MLPVGIFSVGIKAAIDCCESALKKLTEEKKEMLTESVSLADANGD